MIREPVLGSREGLSLEYFHYTVGCVYKKFTKDGDTMQSIPKQPGVLGIDVGTSGMKMAFMILKNVKYFLQEKYPTYYPYPDGLSNRRRIGGMRSFMGWILFGRGI